MSERVSLRPISPDERVSPTPLVLRGHHLNIIYTYYARKGKRTPTQFLGQFSEQVVKKVSDLSVRDQPYTLDVLGESPDETRRFKKQVETVIRRFIELPDDYPLELVEGIPDDICAGCAIGEHCRKLYLAKGSTNAIEEDRDWIHYFVDESHYPDSNVAVSVQRETAYFSDAEPQQVRRIRTTVGTMRKRYGIEIDRTNRNR